MIISQWFFYKKITPKNHTSNAPTFIQGKPMGITHIPGQKVPQSELHTKHCSDTCYHVYKVVHRAPRFKFESNITKFLWGWGGALPQTPIS